ncbi:2-hydroxyacyl-CoA dehydratase subunit D [Chloroflexota bacterium]
MQAIERFMESVEKRHQYAQEWKRRTGKKVMGCFCSYVPEEVVYAAGILPVRVLGSHAPQDIVERYAFGHFCPFSRDCLAQGLNASYHYLDGITMTHSCMHMRQAFDAWRRNVPISYSCYLYMPSNIQTQRAKDCFTEDIAGYRRSLEEWMGQSISLEALDHAIDVYNTNRRLMRQLYSMRRNNSPAISGTDALEIVLSSMVMDKEEHNHLLEVLLDERSTYDMDIESKPRLMVIGSECDVDLIHLIESLGAQVVIEDLCTGSRYFWNEVIPAEDRLSAIAARYLNRPPCPLRDVPEHRRLIHIVNLAKDYNVHGAIIALQKFCEPHSFDTPPIEAALKELGIPTLFLELDFTLAAGQLRVRIEAFLEMLELQLV